ncbi:hypothetical protein [Bacillus sp. NPDC093026]|uniref:hypothetical protein n=1 Tax=Bacillus sp. NPDC093026 TaxID=3363948 RepID=UPI0038307097
MCKCYITKPNEFVWKIKTRRALLLFLQICRRIETKWKIKVRKEQAIYEMVGWVRHAWGIRAGLLLLLTVLIKALERAESLMQLTYVWDGVNR